MQTSPAKIIGIYDVPPSAVVGLMAIPDRDRVIVEFYAFDDISAGHIVIPFKRRDRALSSDVRVRVVPTQLPFVPPAEVEALASRLSGDPVGSVGDKLANVRSQLRRRIASGLPVEYETGALESSVPQELRSRYAALVNAGLRACALASARPGEWVTVQPEYESGRRLFSFDVQRMRDGMRIRALQAITARAEGLGVAQGWMLEAREHISRLMNEGIASGLAVDDPNSRRLPRRTPRGG